MEIKVEHPADNSPPEKRAPEQPSPLALFWIWCRVSVSSFGGGVATLGLIRQEFIVRRKWVTEDDFLRDWSLCQLAPGINLIALVILIGRRMGGGSAIAAALLGLLIPSFIVTVAITAAYQFFSHSSFVAAARNGIVPAVAGVGLATVVTMVVPIARKHWPDGMVTRVFYSIVLVGCFLGFRIAHLSPVIVLLAAGFGGAIFRSLQPKSEDPLS